MVYVVFFVSAAATGTLVALGVRVMGVEHTGIVVGLGVIGGCIQMLILLLWYLLVFSKRPQAVRDTHIEPSQSVE